MVRQGNLSVKVLFSSDFLDWPTREPQHRKFKISVLRYTLLPTPAVAREFRFLPPASSAGVVEWVAMACLEPLTPALVAQA
jgi:hypothetical protein